MNRMKHSEEIYKALAGNPMQQRWIAKNKLRPDQHSNARSMREMADERADETESHLSLGDLGGFEEQGCGREVSANRQLLS